ncbi:MAG: hypothetical protein ACLQVD_02255 [Capsulimonadaceae bacterium]
MASADLYQRQFDLFRRLIALIPDLYAYVTLTAPSSVDISGRIRRFVDDLQRVHPQLPLKTVPLEVRTFSPVRRRLDEGKTLALRNQYDAIQVWRHELIRRFTTDELNQRITDVTLN